MQQQLGNKISWSGHANVSYITYNSMFGLEFALFVYVLW